MLMVEEHHFHMGAGLAAAKNSLTNIIKLEQNFPQVRGGGQGRLGGGGTGGMFLGQPIEKRGIVRFPGRIHCRQGCDVGKICWNGFSAGLNVPSSLPPSLPFMLFTEHLLGARPDTVPEAGDVA